MPICDLVIIQVTNSDMIPDKKGLLLGIVLFIPSMIYIVKYINSNWLPEVISGGKYGK